MNYQYQNYLLPNQFSPNMYQNNAINQNQNVDERIWVQNQVAAESYLVAPNSFVRLWDSSRNVFYEKRADATGRPLALETFEYKKITEKLVEENKVNEDKYIALEKRLNELEEKVYEQSKSISDDAAV